MKFVTYHLLDYEDGLVVPFRLGETEESPTEPAVLSFVEQELAGLPKGAYKKHPKYQAWEVTFETWIRIRSYLEKHGYTAKKESDVIPSGISGGLYLIPLGAAISICAPMLFWGFVTHLLLSRQHVSGEEIRAVLCAPLCVLLVLAVRRQQKVLILLSVGLILLFNPIWSVHFGNWWLWQLLDWLCVVFLIIGSFAVHFEEDQLEQESSWWYRFN